MNYKLLAYAQDFSSFLVQSLGTNTYKIKQIILFGSVSRGQASEKSDVDIFVEVIDKNIEKMIEKIKDEFFDSVKVTKYWRLFGIQNDINCHVGRLEDWPDLKISIIANGIILFGKYKGIPEINPYYLFTISPGKNRSKNIQIWRKLYGYTQKVGTKKYEKKGLIRELEGQKIAKAVFIIPGEHTTTMQEFLRKNKLMFKLFPFWQD